MSSDLNNLADRVEAAGGADRAIDYDIALAVGAKARNGHVNIAPPYTASIDIALTLVPEGWAFLMASSPLGAVCDVHTKPLGQVGEWPGQARAATPALALTAAALRARAQENEHGA